MKDDDFLLVNRNGTSYKTEYKDIKADVVGAANLQAVTNAGNTTTKAIEINGKIKLNENGFITTQATGFVNLNVTNGALLSSTDGTVGKATCIIGHDGKITSGGDPSGGAKVGVQVRPAGEILVKAGSTDAITVYPKDSTSKTVEVSAAGAIKANNVTLESYLVCKDNAIFAQSTDATHGVFVGKSGSTPDIDKDWNAAIRGDGTIIGKNSLTILDPAQNGYKQGLVCDKDNSGSYLQVYTEDGSVNNPFSVYNGTGGKVVANIEPSGTIRAGALKTSEDDAQGTLLGQSGVVYAQVPSTEGDSTQLWRGYKGKTLKSYITAKGDAYFAGQAEIVGGIKFGDNTVQTTAATGGGGAGAAKAWVNFNGTDGSKNDSFNIDAITNVSKGVWVINFDTNMDTDKYAVIGSSCNYTGDLTGTVVSVDQRTSYGSSGGNTGGVDLKTVSQVRITTAAGTTSFDPAQVYVAFFES